MIIGNYTFRCAHCEQYTLNWCYLRRAAVDPLQLFCQKGRATRMAMMRADEEKIVEFKARLAEVEENTKDYRQANKNLRAQIVKALEDIRELESSNRGLSLTIATMTSQKTCRTCGLGCNMNCFNCSLWEAKNV